MKLKSANMTMVHGVSKIYVSRTNYFLNFNILVIFGSKSATHFSASVQIIKALTMHDWDV